MKKFLLSEYDNNVDTTNIAKSILSEVDQFIIIVFQPVVWMITNAILLIGIIIYLVITDLNASLTSLFLLSLFYLLFYGFSRNILNGLEITITVLLLNYCLLLLFSFFQYNHIVFLRFVL